jgi:hypothetical protein
MVFLELLVGGCFLNLGEKCGFVIIKSEKTAIPFHLEQKTEHFLCITVNGEERNLDHSVLQTLAKPTPQIHTYFSSFLVYSYYMLLL